VEVVRRQSRTDEVGEHGGMKLGEEEEVGMMEHGLKKNTPEVNWKVLGTKALT